MSEIKSEIKGVMNEISDITELLYQQKENEGYTKLNVTLEKISGCIEKLFMLKVESAAIDFDPNKLIGVLGEALNALKDKDAVLLADILQYDLQEQFMEIYDKLD